MDNEIQIVGIAAGFFIDKGKIFIAQRKADDEDGSKWEFPGGRLLDDELYDDALKREFKEEFNIDIDVIQEVGGAEFEKDNNKIVITFFLVEGDFNKIELKVHQQTKFVSFIELEKMDLCNPDRDFITVFKEEIKKLLVN
ncbi:MAG: NUDIX domain-containing protein [Spirochaetes bacterium]|nr:NUDIX domain-containing protein [Spirochaetota bacterium]